MFFEFGIAELMMIAVVGLLVIGPERLPETLRTLGLWLGRLRRSFVSVKAEIEKEIGMDEVKRQLHNEAVMEEMRRIEQEVSNSMNESILDPNINAHTDTHTDSQAHAVAEHDIAPESTPHQPAPISEAELEAQHAAKLKQANAQKDSPAEDSPAIESPDLDSPKQAEQERTEQDTTRQ